MNPVTQVLGFKSIEKLLLKQGFVICEETGQKITRIEDLTTVHLAFGKDQLLVLPVHKDHANALLQTIRHTFSSGVPALEDEEALEFRCRE
jgi:hypothetical protein